MTDYQAMYLEMARAAEKAIRILIEAQQEAEEMYLSLSNAGDRPRGGDDVG